MMLTTVEEDERPVLNCLCNEQCCWKENNQSKGAPAAAARRLCFRGQTGRLTHSDADGEWKV